MEYYIIITCIFIFIGGIAYLLETSTDKMAWRKYIQKCLEDGKEPTMTLDEYTTFLRMKTKKEYQDSIEKIRSKKQAERDNNDKYFDDVELWMKRLKK